MKRRSRFTNASASSASENSRLTSLTTHRIAYATARHLRLLLIDDHERVSARSFARNARVDEDLHDSRARMLLVEVLEQPLILRGAAALPYAGLLIGRRKERAL